MPLKYHLMKERVELERDITIHRLEEPGPELQTSQPGRKCTSQYDLRKICCVGQRQLKLFGLILGIDNIISLFVSLFRLACSKILKAHYKVVLKN